MNEALPQSDRSSSHATSSGNLSNATSGIRTAPSGYEQFSVDELAIVLSYFDIGVIESIKEYPRGSRRAPKLLIKSEMGTYLLKRRARGKDDAQRVAFCHSIQLHLSDCQFPLPHLMGTKKDNNSMLLWNDNIYELFEYIKGTRFDNSLEAAGDSGAILALFHKLLIGFKSPYEPPRGSYHRARSVGVSFERLPKTLDILEQKKGWLTGEARRAGEILAQSYEKAAQTVDDLGMNTWPEQIVHSDWHTGNLLYRGTHVVAVIDYDAARIHHRVSDIANGALQFSVIREGPSPSAWPNNIDEARFKQFLKSYDERQVLSKAELKAIPWLMIEATIAEAIIPIAATGYLGKIDAMVYLPAVTKRAKWLENHAERLSNCLEV